MKLRILLGLFIITIASSFCAAQSASSNTVPDKPPASWQNAKYATGNWGGLRDRLVDTGIDPFWYWTGIGSGNPTGGNRRGFTLVDDSYFGVHLDLGKLSGWKGSKLTISGVNRDGRGLTNHYIGSQYNSQQSVGGQNIFFYQLRLDQKLLDGKLSLAAGRFSASDDLNASPIYGYYVNNGIDGDIRNVLFDTQSSAYPFATWAGLVRVDPNPQFNAEFGVYQTWDRIFDPTHNGLDWTFHPDDGVIFMAQAGWTPEFFKKPVDSYITPDGKTVTGPAMKGLPGHFWLGGTYSPWKGFAQFGSSVRVADSYGFYVNADQMVYQKKPGGDQGLTVWAASGYYPQGNISIVPFQVNIGLIYKGLIRNRGEDRSIFGVIYGKFSRDYAHTVVAQGNGNPRHEAVIEAAHRIQLTKFAFIQPDIQWVGRPAGTGKIPNAVVVGAEMGLAF
jgi:porin